MRVGVIGAGAIGGWLASGFLEAGTETIVLARGKTLAALRDTGLTLSSVAGRKTYPVAVTESPEDLQGVDLLVLGLKAHDLPGAAPMLARAVGPETRVLPAINGLPWWYFAEFGGPLRGRSLETVDPGKALARLFPAERVIGCVLQVASLVEAPGHVRLVNARKVWLGDAGGGSAAPRVAALMQKGGVPAEATERLHWEVWSKLMGNASFNPLSALTRGTIAEMLADPHVRASVTAVMQEMHDLGGRLGLEDLAPVADRMAMSERLGSFKTSMLQDVEAGRRLEVEPIIGSVSEVAAAMGQPMPMLDTVCGMVRLLDKGLSN